MTLIHMHHWSDALAKASSLFVTVPDGATGPLPLVCLLHGLSDDHTIWQRRTSIERYAQRHGVMVMMPDGGRTWYCDSELGRYQAHILESIDHVERLLPAVGTRAGRAIAGLSMGGYGAFKIALRHPERFCAAVSHSGALDAIRFADDRDCPEAKYIFTGRGARAEDCFALARTLRRRAGRALPALRFDCGVDDELIDDNRAFRTHLQRLGIAHEYAEHPGGHSWEYWDQHIDTSLDFLRRHLATPAAPKRTRATRRRPSSRPRKAT